MLRCVFNQFLGKTPQDPIGEITVEELKRRMDVKENFLLLDVRELSEYQTVSIPGARLVPLPELQKRAGELETFKKKEIIAYCHFGGRSRKALEILLACGFKNLKNLKGGVDAWALKIDPSCPRY